MPVAGQERATSPIATGSEWTTPILEKFDAALIRHAQRNGLVTFPVQYEVITADQMLDLCSTVGMPVHYAHWSFGKQLVSQERGYRKGLSGLAYEIVINTNPSLVYLMETNTLALQVLVMAHAAYGHNAFFRNNYLFQQFTQPDAILDYLKFANGYVVDCEQRYGWREVEKTLDCCHALSSYGVDRYRKPKSLSARRESERLAERLRFAERHFNPDYAYLFEKPKPAEGAEDAAPFEPQENLLYFIEKRAPKLAPWQRELVRIVRKVAQYFYPSASPRWRMRVPQPSGTTPCCTICMTRARSMTVSCSNGSPITATWSRSRRSMPSTITESIRTRWVLRSIATSGGSVSSPVERTASGSRNSPDGTGARRSTSQWPISRTRA
jgi:stage V sporulation protein R